MEIKKMVVVEETEILTLFSKSIVVGRRWHLIGGRCIAVWLGCHTTSDDQKALALELMRQGVKQ